MAYELLIKNGTVVDGTGAARYQADVGVANGRIVTIDPTRKLSEVLPTLSMRLILLLPPALLIRIPTTTRRSAGTR